MKGLATALYKEHKFYAHTIITLGDERLYSGYYCVGDDKIWIDDVSDNNKLLTDIIEYDFFGNQIN